MTVLVVLYKQSLAMLVEGEAVIGHQKVVLYGQVWTSSPDAGDWSIVSRCSCASREEGPSLGSGRVDSYLFGQFAAFVTILIRLLNTLWKGFVEGWGADRQGKEECGLGIQRTPKLPAGSGTGGNR